MTLPHFDRKTHIGASEVAALFDVHPFLSKFELWHQKKGNLPAPNLDDVERVQWGNFLEAGIASGLAKMHDWTLSFAEPVVHATVKGMAATPDYTVHEERGDGLLEIKNVDYLQWRNWENDEPPLAYILQLQHQLACTGLKWGRIGWLIGGNTSGFREYEAKPKTIAEIERRVEWFWKTIELNEPPDPNFMIDAGTVIGMHKDVVDESYVDLSHNDYLRGLCANFVSHKASEKTSCKLAEALKAEILMFVEGAETAKCQEFRIKSIVNKGSPERIAKEGEIIKGRAGSRSIKITEKENIDG